MTDIDTSAAAVSALLEGVTAGPWVAVAAGQADDLNEVVKETPFQSVADCEGSTARFIAAARDLVPALVAERDALRAEVERLRAAEISVRDAAVVLLNAYPQGPGWAHETCMTTNMVQNQLRKLAGLKGGEA